MSSNGSQPRPQPRLPKKLGLGHDSPVRKPKGFALGLRQTSSPAGDPSCKKYVKSVYKHAHTVLQAMFACRTLPEVRRPKTRSFNSVPAAKGV